MTWDQIGAALAKWGGLLLGAVGTWLGVRSELRSRREHAWKEEDAERKRIEWERAEKASATEGLCLAWCREQAAELEKQAPNFGGFLYIPQDKLEWARWGEAQGYFQVNTRMPGTPILVRRT